MPPVTTPRRPRGTRAAAARAAEARRRRRVLVAGSASGLVVLIIAALVIVKLASGGGHSSAPGAEPVVRAAPAVLARLGGIAPASLARAAASTSVNRPQAVSNPTVTTGAPHVFYLGADYCPFCAAQRWALVTALSHFGTWTDLATTSSAADDVYPNTATFSFHGASFSSPYLTFAGVETATNRRTSTGYAPLDTPTAEQAQIVQTYDRAGSIPFLDLGGRFIQSGSSFVPTVLAGMTVDEISAEAADSSTAAGRQIQAAAGVLVADLCQLTNQQPANVCSAFS